MNSEPTLLVRRLVSSLQDKMLISIYERRGEPEDFSVGWIVGLTQEAYILATVDDLGRRDSHYVGSVEDIHRVVDGGDYLEAIGRLMMNHVDPETPTLPESSIPGVLGWARECSELVTIHDRIGIETHGYVTETDAEAISLHAYTKTGGDDGNMAILLADVFGVEFGGPTQKTIGSLIR